METPKEKTSRITREIEEERKLRHQQMDQSFKTQKQIRNSEQKEAKKEKQLQARVARNQKIRKLLEFVCSRNLLIFLFVIVALVLGILFWRTILDVLYQFWFLSIMSILRILKWIFLPLITLGLLWVSLDNSYRYNFLSKRRGAVFWWAICWILLMYFLWIFEEIQWNLEENRKWILALCAIIITWRIVVYTNQKKEH